ncbi:MAG: HAMP domain-containing histidine kinase [Acidobacteria bacterium]|jgi:signal transduction histidine kinase|nr:HAMP domain-containing histidine kinase [Acidobacteriota bacterium]
MKPLGLESRLARWGARGGFVLAGSGLLLLILFATAWASQARLLSFAVEQYAKDEADSLARLLLYDLAGDQRIKECARYEARMAEMKMSNGAVEQGHEISMGLMEFVRNNLSLPDAMVWDAANRFGYQARLSDVVRARYLLYREALLRDRESLSEDMDARVTFSDHLRGLWIHSRNGLVDIRAGEPIPEKGASVRGMSASTFPLYVEGAYFADVAVLSDRGYIESIRLGLSRSLGWLQAGLALFFVLALCGWALGWSVLIKNLRKTVVEPVTSLARRMEAWEQERPSSPRDPDEARWLSTAFEALLRRVAEQRQQLLNAQRLGLMERIGAGLSHELNNAMNPIRLRLDEMLMEENPPSREDLKALKEHILSAQRILKDLSLPGRKPSGPPERVSPDEWLSPALRLVEPQFEQGPRLLREVSGACAVMGWPEALVEIAVNLLLNARDAAATKGNAGEVMARLAPGDEGWADFSVSDNGPGIPAEVRAHIGEPFVTSKSSGTGLGLFVVDLLVKRMGGTVSFENAPSGGTTVRVRLPSPATRKDGDGRAD